MSLAPFTYRRAGSLAEALQLAAAPRERAQFMAGGHSLLPMMKLRLEAPDVVIDIGRLREFSYIRDEGDQIAVGALTRHHDLERSRLLGRDLPLLACAASHVGDPQVRHRGTIGGSLVHGDPTADLPCVALATDATMIVCGLSGCREIAARDFFRGLHQTALRPGELVVEVRFPKPASPGWSFQRFAKRAIDYAIVGVAVQEGRVALMSMGPTPLRAVATEQALTAGAMTADAAMVATEGTQPPSDLRASRRYREHLARVLVRRALEECRLRSGVPA